MAKTTTFLTALLVLLYLILFPGQATAIELLTDGGFESGVGIPSWDLQESIFDQTTMMPRDFGSVNSAQQQDFGPQSGDLALWLRAFVGEDSAGPNTLSNASLSQVVPGAAGEDYTFSGWSRWELNYSGGVGTLNSNGPLGAVPSPTETTMQLAFLDVAGAVIGSPTTLDLRTEQSNIDFWAQHELTATAPSGTDSVRISADVSAMLWNGGGSESAFYDNFSLIAASAETTELLGNQDLEELPLAFDPAYVVTESPGGMFPMDPTVSVGDFANRSESGGQLGLWLRSFVGNSAQPADAIVSQTVDGVAGADYSFSAWSNFQTNYSGGDSSFGTQTLMEMVFLDGSGTEIGTPLILDLVADGQVNDAVWREHSLNGTAPAGTASVRVSAMGLGMEGNPLGGQQSAFFDDFSLDGPGIQALAGDYDGDGLVSAGDLNLVLNNWGLDGTTPPAGWVNDFPVGIISAEELNGVLNAWGNSAAPFAVPEPSSLGLAFLGLLLFARRRS